MIEALLGVVTSGGFGAVVGGIFSWVQAREKRKNLELELAHEVKMADIDRAREEADQAHSLAMADKTMELAEVEGQIAADVADAEIRAATVEAQSRPSGHPLIDGILRFVRPALTVYLLVVVSIIGYNLHELTGGLTGINPDTKQPFLKPQEIFELYQHIVNQTVFLAVTATTWWFGSRGVSKK